MDKSLYSLSKAVSILRLSHKSSIERQDRNMSHPESREIYYVRKIVIIKVKRHSRRPSAWSKRGRSGIYYYCLTLIA